MKFVVGQEYRRKSLHDEFGGSRQGGISPSRKLPIAFLISSPSGHQHGYTFDGFQQDGTYWYTGEGRTGDMQFKAGNRRIRDSVRDNRELHLFEESRRHHLRYIGQAHYIGHHLATAPDTHGSPRTAIVFHLALDVESSESVPSNPILPAPKADSSLIDKSLAELRAAALERAPATAPASLRKAVVYRRSEAVKLYVLKRAGGICESCKATAPFHTLKGAPYLEPHHIRRVSDGGPDHPRWVAAVCPNCHRHIHYGSDGKTLNDELAAYVGSIETGSDARRGEIERAESA